MISSQAEYEKAEQELRDLQSRLDDLKSRHPHGEKGFTKAGIRKMMARLNEELAIYEGSHEISQPPSEK